MNAALYPSLKARRVQFDFQDTPVHWIPNDAFSSHMINGINLLLPAGELWFCRVYNKALPYVTSPQLRADVEGFIRQEAVHARAHIKAEAHLQDHGFDSHGFKTNVEKLFASTLGEAPFGQKRLQSKRLEKHWLVLRVGIIAAIEHFTGVLGQWSLDSTSWDKADPVMADLFRWHLAEEVEHRSVAFELFEHLCSTQLGFYISRQALMALVFPLFIYFLIDGGRSLAQQDSDTYSKWIARQAWPRLLLEFERVGRRTDNVPTFSLLVAATLRWLSPSFHPVHEGNTAQALSYLARSPAAQRAAQNNKS